MNDPKTVYKVVLNTGISLHSLTRSVAWSREYPPDVWVSGSLNSKLFVYDTLDHAVAYAQTECSRRKPVEVWVARATGVEPVPGLLSMNWEVWPLFWQSHAIESRIAGLWMDAPKGTLFADKVKIVARIWPEA